MDPLTDVLALLDLRGAQFARLEAQEPWAVGFSGYRHIKFGAVLQGGCRISVAGLPGSVMLGEGDCYLIGSGRAYELSGGPAVPAVPSAEVFADYTEGATVRIGSACDAVVVGCGFDLDEANAAVLVDVLPPLVHLGAAAGTAGAVRAALELLRTETESPGWGTPFVTERLAHVLLVHLLRAHVAERGTAGGGWLTALADRQIGAALALMHETPAHRWTVAGLAAKVGMSRSQFAARFSECVGVPPLEYLVSWRIRSAARELRTTDRTVSAIASRWGYGAESSFSHAFKRVMGVAPGRYRVTGTHAGRETAPR
ncbi:AraC family transcriptional regulator [Peterkaempfera griseoplana]|uniref:AraC family transcriptional regulator n=1 Tax=Peterkaempfera griseoplana TaxID=66896 RepID=UPI0006E152CA|nr:AraC family transcriptional regulator [Peterkaempfera griseoplana]